MPWLIGSVKFAVPFMVVSLVMNALESSKLAQPDAVLPFVARSVISIDAFPAPVGVKESSLVRATGSPVPVEMPTLRYACAGMFVLKVDALTPTAM